MVGGISRIDFRLWAGRGAFVGRRLAEPRSVPAARPGPCGGLGHAGGPVGLVGVRGALCRAVGAPSGPQVQPAISGLGGHPTIDARDLQRCRHEVQPRPAEGVGVPLGPRGEGCRGEPGCGSQRPRRLPRLAHRRVGAAVRGRVARGVAAAGLGGDRRIQGLRRVPDPFVSHGRLLRFPALVLPGALLQKWPERLVLPRGHDVHRSRGAVQRRQGHCLFSQHGRLGCREHRVGR
mmetsp:Transcript_10808/g.28208  ORF Transcript_10808/g.28208 Transcript_10808/m.28208 type:complete len:234 (+) Transcript_10808:249-950(+)